MARGTTVDTHFMGPKKVRELGLSKRPPGTGPGEFMHQRGHFRPPTAQFIWKEVPPMAILGGLVLAGLGLGCMTMYRQLAVCPSVLVDRKKRNTVPEMESPGEIVELAKRYVDSPIRHWTYKQPDLVRQWEPPALPGDPSPQGPGPQMYQ